MPIEQHFGQLNIFVYGRINVLACSHFGQLNIFVYGRINDIGLLTSHIDAKKIVFPIIKCDNLTLINVYLQVISATVSI